MTAFAEQIETGMAVHSTAAELAAAWEIHSATIRRLVVELSEATASLNAAFASESINAFCVRIGANSHTTEDASPAAAETILKEFETAAWRVLISKLGIRKTMSAKRAAELDAALNLGRRHVHYHGESPPVVLPPISEETILGVVAGFAASADEFLNEAITEEYDWWKPDGSGFKRNSSFTLNRKIIRTWMVERGHLGHFRPIYSSEQHLRALDQIFHLLDGRGTLPGYDSPLIEAIKRSGANGTGETVYFRFKCFKNGNLHLEFKFEDLLQRFNQIAGRNRLPGTTKGKA